MQADNSRVYTIVSAAMFGVAVLCFMLPWFNDGYSDKYTGFAFAFGIGDEFDGMSMPIITIAFLAALAGCGLSFIQYKVIPAITALTGANCLLIFYGFLSFESRGYGDSTPIEMGFWLTLLLLGAASVINFIEMQKAGMLMVQPPPQPVYYPYPQAPPPQAPPRVYPGTQQAPYPQPQHPQPQNYPRPQHPEPSEPPQQFHQAPEHERHESGRPPEYIPPEPQAMPGSMAGSHVPHHAHGEVIEGKTCPYCQGTFKPGVRTVTCSLCGMPHHEECWRANGGCTTYGCNGVAVLN